MTVINHTCNIHASVQCHLKCHLIPLAFTSYFREIYSIQLTSFTVNTSYIACITSPSRACCCHKEHVSDSDVLTNQETKVRGKGQLIEAFSAHLPNLITFVKNRQQEVLGRTTCLLSFDTTRTAQKSIRPAFILLLRVYSLPR
jgi:hypothetical protein